MFQFPESYSKFATYVAAISGSSFWESSKQASSLLQRNSLSVTGSEFFVLTQPAISGMSFPYSLLQPLAVYGVLECFRTTDSVWNTLIAEYCFLATFLGVSLVLGPISTSIDTDYICYAMEKDAGNISRPELCHNYMLLLPKEALEDRVSVA